MNFLGFNIERKAADLPIDEVMRRLEAAFETVAGVVVTPENCEESPTVQAIVNAISMHLMTLPVHVYQKKLDAGRESKEQLPSHPVARLLAAPNSWTTAASFWQDLGSTLVRWGRYYAIKGRGVTGPIRQLVPLRPSAVQLLQDPLSYDVTARVSLLSAEQRVYPLGQLFHVRARSRDFLCGDSPVMAARDAIALEIAAQRMGSALFGNGAMPGLIFKAAPGTRMSEEQRKSFADSFQAAYGASKRFRALVLPGGIEVSAPITIENEKAQFLETRKLQRNIIAGAFGVPPHLVGDLERGTFSNIEHQSLEFTQKVILPYVLMIEDAIEHDLLTDEDRRSGVIVRFNVDASLRADFRSRQEGLKIQREAGIISPNDWREREGMNPIDPEDGGDSYWQQGPSGQTGQGAAAMAGAKPGAKPGDGTGRQANEPAPEPQV